MVHLIILIHSSYFIYLILFIQFECELENIQFHKEQEILSWVAASDLSIAHVPVHKEHILGLTFNFLFVCTSNVIPHLINWNIVAHYKIPSKISTNKICNCNWMCICELKNVYLHGVGTSVTFWRTWMSMNLVLSPAPKFFRAHFNAYLLDLELLTANPMVIGGSLGGGDSVTTMSSWVVMTACIPCTRALLRGTLHDEQLKQQDPESRNCTTHLLWYKIKLNIK